MGTSCAALMTRSARGSTRSRPLAMRGRSWRDERSDCFSECVRRGLQAITDVGELFRGSINALLLLLRALLLGVNELLLAVSARLLAVSALSHRLELSCHRLDRAGQLGQLASDTGNVLFASHVFGF